MNSHKLNSSKVLSRRYISHFTARDVEAQSSETLSIVSCIHVPLYTPLLPLQKAWKGDRKTLPRQAVPLDRFCRISEAEMSCTEHNQQSHRRAEDSSCHLKGTQLPTATTDKALHMATHKKSAQGKNQAVFITLEHPRDTAFQEKQALILTFHVG